MSQPALFTEDAHGKYRWTDPDTSRLAVVDAIGKMATNRRLVLDCLHWAGDDGMTDFELEARTGVAQTSIGKRRGELRDAGYVRRAVDVDGKGMSRPAPSGSAAAVWVLTAKGYAAAETVT